MHKISLRTLHYDPYPSPNPPPTAGYFSEDSSTSLEEGSVLGGVLEGFVNFAIRKGFLRLENSAFRFVKRLLGTVVVFVPGEDFGPSSSLGAGLDCSGAAFDDSGVESDGVFGFSSFIIGYV